MEFNIEKTATEYVYKRFPEASIPEKEKIIRDWVRKIEDSKSLVRDFTGRVGNPVGKKLIDVGSGPGGISIAFALAGAEVTGLEIEQELFQISQDHAVSFGVSPNFVLYDGNKIPFEDNTFDYGVSSSVLEHTDDPVQYLAEILRVIKPGGKLYLGFPNKLAPKETHTQLYFLTYIPQFLQNIYVRARKRNPLPSNNLHFYGYFDLARMLKKVENSNSMFKWSVVPEAGQSQNLFKKAVRNVLQFFGIPYKMFLPHILVVLKKIPHSL